MPDIGSTLREARMRDRIDISEVEAQTKIRAKYLRAIENEEWDLLPGPVYAKSFLRTYGDYLGLDSRMLVDEFRRRYEGPADQDFRPVASRPPRERDRHPRPRRAPSWLPIAIVLVLVVVALGIIGSLNTSNNSTTGTNAQSGSATHHHTARHHAATTAAKPPGPHEGHAASGAHQPRLRLSGQRRGNEADQRADLRIRPDDSHRKRAAAVVDPR